MSTMVQYGLEASSYKPSSTQQTTNSELAPKTADERLASTSLLSLSVTTSSSSENQSSPGVASSSFRSFSDLSSTKSPEMKLPSLRQKFCQDPSQQQATETDVQTQPETQKQSSPVHKPIYFPVYPGTLGNNPTYVKGVFNATICMTQDGVVFVRLPPEDEKKAIETSPKLVEYANMTSSQLQRQEDDVPSESTKKRSGVKRALTSRKITTPQASEGSPSKIRRKTCSREGCERAVRRQGLCGRHGGRETCQVPNCKKFARGKNKLCHRHLPDATKPQCVTPNCKRAPQVAGKLCYSCATNTTSNARATSPNRTSSRSRQNSTAKPQNPSIVPRQRTPIVHQYQSGQPVIHGPGQVSCSPYMWSNQFDPNATGYYNQGTAYGMPLPYGAHYQTTPPMQPHQPNSQFIYPATKTF